MDRVPCVLTFVLLRINNSSLNAPFVARCSPLCVMQQSRFREMVLDTLQLFQIILVYIIDIRVTDPIEISFLGVCVGYGIVRAVGTSSVMGLSSLGLGEFSPSGLATHTAVSRYEGVDAEKRTFINARNCDLVTLREL
jgi:hypothetical protein